jgi:hypothetical protein
MPDEEIPPGTDLEGGAGGQHDPAPEWRPPASQEELDRLINKATAKVHGKYKDYDSVRERAGLYDQLLAQTQTDSERAAAEAEERAYNAAMGSVVPGWSRPSSGPPPRASWTTGSSKPSSRTST